MAVLVLGGGCLRRTSYVQVCAMRDDGAPETSAVVWLGQEGVLMPFRVQATGVTDAHGCVRLRAALGGTLTLKITDGLNREYMMRLGHPKIDGPFNLRLKCNLDHAQPELVVSLTECK